VKTRSPQHPVVSIGANTTSAIRSRYLYK